LSINARASRRTDLNPQWTNNQATTKILENEDFLYGASMLIVVIVVAEEA